MCELDAEHHPDAANLLDGVEPLERAQALEHVVAELARALRQPLALDDVEVRERDSGADRMAVVREPVPECGAVEELEHAVADEHRTHRDVPARERLRGHDHVGVDPVPLRTEPVAGSSVRRHDLVEDEQDAVRA